MRKTKQSLLDKAEGSSVLFSNCDLSAAGPGGGKIEAWVPSTRPGSRAWELTDFDDIQDPILKAEEILKGRMAFEPVQERHLKVDGMTVEASA